MTLSEWMASAKLKDSGLAAQIGVDRTRIVRYRLNKGTPSLKTAVAIERLSRGKIKASSWFVEGSA